MPENTPPRNENLLRATLRAAEPTRERRPSKGIRRRVPRVKNSVALPWKFFYV
jgi:hypothetical protein